MEDDGRVRVGINWVSGLCICINFKVYKFGLKNPGRLVQNNNGGATIISVEIPLYKHGVSRCRATIYNEGRDIRPRTQQTVG